MIDSYYRAPFQKWLVDPLAKRLAVSPVAITLLGLFSGLGAGLLMALGSQFMALALLALSGYCDVLDGSLARFRKKSSPVGATLDLICDRAVEFAMLFAFFLIDPLGRSVAVMVMFGSIYLCIASFFSVSMFTEGESDKSFVYSPGLIERAETFIVFFLMILFPKYFNAMAWAYSGAVFLTSALRLGEFIRRS